MSGNNPYERRLSRMLATGSTRPRGGAGRPDVGAPQGAETVDAPPVSDGRPQAPGAPRPLYYRGKGSGAGGTRRRLMQLNLHNAFETQGPLWNSIRTLVDQANTNRFSPEQRAQYLAPRMEAIGSMENAALGNLTRTTMGRGLDESSYGGAAEAAVLGQGVATRANAINGLAAAEEARQLQSQALLRDLLMNLQGKSSQQASSIADNITKFKMEQAALDAQNSFGFGDFFSALGGIGGSAARLGWQPLKITG
ncbi:MAG: hypothetical protein ACO1SX_20135 [Actinomycetota bacterium]